MKLYAIALAGVAAVVLAAPAAAGPTGWYLGLGIGWNNPNGGNFSTNCCGSGNLNLDDTAAYMGSFGYKWNNGWRAELELNYTDPDLGSGLGGDLTKTALMANINYDIPVGQRVNLVLGAGAGISWIDPSSTVFSGVDQQFVWQGIAGLSFALSDSFEIQVDYRYVSFNDSQHRLVGIPGGRATLSDLQDNRIMASFRWQLWHTTAPPPPPPPPPPPMVKTFIVFFDFDKSNLTAEAQKVVAEAVDTAKKTGMVRVLITGHTDTVGSRQYNQGLSERRAASVKSEMVRLGMSEGEISTVGKNFSEPLVPTGPGVREPQNRRAVIDLG
jgi:outer membrane protein OmpA-like peptidoglycan-associated protein/opacity protein-like surface antigen